MLPQPSLPMRANSDTGTSRTNLAEEAAAAEILDTSMPTEILRTLGVPNGIDGDDDREIQRLLEAAAKTNTFDDGRWTETSKFIKQMITKHVDKFKQDEGALFDKANEPPWILEADEIAALVNEVFALLDQFVSSPPHTIQRLAELVLSPSPYYGKSLAKYMRALTRCLLVTSHARDFPPLPPQQAPGGANTEFPSRSANPSLSSSPILPLLSPIPFLHRNLVDDSNDSVENSALSNDPMEPNRNVLLQSPTGGRIDELDLGPEAREEALRNGNGSADPASMADSPIGLGLEQESLAEKHTDKNGDVEMKT